MYCRDISSGPRLFKGKYAAIAARNTKRRLGNQSFTVDRAEYEWNVISYLLAYKQNSLTNLLSLPRPNKAVLKNTLQADIFAWAKVTISSPIKSSCDIIVIQEKNNYTP